MKTAIAFLAAVLLASCVDITVPPRRCAWRYTEFGIRTDTVWNTVPGGQPPFLLVTRTIPIDSVRNCP